LAAKDLQHIENYIKQDNPLAAIDVVLSIIDTVETLILNNTYIGKSGRVYGTREFIVPDYQSYIIIYRVHDNKLEVIRILHGARKWPPDN